ncbi:hypothetical protein D3OALGA1CA_836 [Olavius algarvensis associated proteobacterium Delta 3]|nr:hypothetical protein D3OALGA1CA_836 [Olavius algarvensis associated proteobacterium Delta 3]CAB5142901.1 hypothetical protein D3OALGB2SA_4340 [Olavius algarvensis associated proteobacterium Delta 3]
MSESTLRDELYAAFKNRAMMVYHIYCELTEEVGEQRATDILKRSIYRRGVEIGNKFKQHAPQDLHGLSEAFLGGVPDGGRMFQPEVVHCDDTRLDIQLHRCPLKEAWQEAGLTDGDIARLCHIAAAVDDGTFEGAGFSFSAETWQPGQKGCCLLRIRPGRGD